MLPSLHDTRLVPRVERDLEHREELRCLLPIRLAVAVEQARDGSSVLPHLRRKPCVAPSESRQSGPDEREGGACLDPQDRASSSLHAGNHAVT